MGTGMNLVIVGRGRMGSLVASEAEARGWNLVAHLDKEGVEDPAALEGFGRDGVPSAVIDFSSPAALSWVVPFVREHGVALVSGTTGMTDADKGQLAGLAVEVPVCWSANYSRGIAVLERALALVAGGSGPLTGRYDCEIVERHHRNKADAPSGTAIALANAVDPEGREARVMGRSGMGARTNDELGISSVRGGTVAGIHEVCFYGNGESLTFTHAAENRTIFADGALDAAEMLQGRAPGMYVYADMLFEGSATLA